jgi:hypothetical protein
MNDGYIVIFGILHSLVYTFFEKACIIELKADVETRNLKLGNASTSLYFFQFPIYSFKFHCQNTISTKCKLLLTCREGCLIFDPKTMTGEVSMPQRRMVAGKEQTKMVSCILTPIRYNKYRGYGDDFTRNHS